MSVSISFLTCLFFASSAEALPEMELSAALDAKVVVIKARGSGMSEVQLTLTAKNSIVLSIPTGTFFDTKGSEYQRMVVVEGVRVRLEAGVSLEMKVKTACANFHRRVPLGQDEFVMGQPPEGLADLVRCLEQKGVKEIERQFVIWKYLDKIDEIQLEKNPGMLLSLLVYKCEKRLSESRQRCEEIAREGMAFERKMLLEMAPILLDECKGTEPRERKRDKMKPLFEHRDGG
jgi:hypothetical protein